MVCLIVRQHIIHSAEVLLAAVSGIVRAEHQVMYPHCARDHTVSVGSTNHYTALLSVHKPDREAESTNFVYLVTIPTAKPRCSTRVRLPGMSDSSLADFYQLWTSTGILSVSPQYLQVNPRVGDTFP